ncbi:hypothetical protein M434DRAFT_26698 [Hypoxylon sp. CO27-5]|nr:hypothetical protein M434DRAFT_26698 [Hypoxylon sp. CO27-5]
MAPQDRPTTLFEHIDSLNSITALLKTYNFDKTTRNRLCNLDLDEALLVLNVTDWELKELVSLKNYLAWRTEHLDSTTTSEAEPDWIETVLLAADVMRNCPFLGKYKYPSMEIPILLHISAISRLARAVKSGVHIRSYVLKTYKIPKPESINRNMREHAAQLRNERPPPPPIPERSKPGALSRINTRDWTKAQLREIPGVDPCVGGEKEIRKFCETLSKELKYLRGDDDPSLDDLIEMDACALRGINHTRTSLKRLGVDTPSIPELTRMLPPDSIKHGRDSPDPDEVVPPIPPPSAYVRGEVGTSAAGSQSESTETRTGGKRRRLLPPLDLDRIHASPPSRPPPRTLADRLVIPPINPSGPTVNPPSIFDSSDASSWPERDNSFRSAPNSNLAPNSQPLPTVIPETVIPETVRPGYIVPEVPLQTLQDPPPPYSLVRDPRESNPWRS